uniref:Uncharacterized protein n=1 Tax=viral metagenome TaxID=1070528 RepID=A0A6C0HU17_9ZZZZ
MASGTGLSYINSPTQSGSGSSMLGNSVLPHGAGGATHQYESRGGYPEFSHLSQHRKTLRRKPKSKGKRLSTQNGGRKIHSKSRKHKQRRTRSR